MVGGRLRATALQASPWARAHWLVLAPHPDDETLGVAALISQTVATDRLVKVAYLTDGAGSHPHPDPASRGRLVAARRREARQALRRLGEHGAPMFLDWPDAAPAEVGTRVFEAARQRLAHLCRRRRVDAIAVTAAHEPHCDHAAACALARAVARSAIRPVQVFEYVVWAPPPAAAAQRAYLTAPMSVGARRAALAAHRSQLTPLYGPGFRLAEDQRCMTPLDRLYRQRRHVR